MIQTMTDQEKKTIRNGIIVISIYLVLWFGVGRLKKLETLRSDYELLYKEAQNLQQEFEPYENKVQRIEKLRKTFQMDPNQLNRETLVGKVSAEIQQAAKMSGVKLGPIRESPGRSSARELGSMQFEGTGRGEAMIQLLQKLKNLGYPLIVNSVLILSDSKKPGQIKLTLEVIILDFDQWKKKEVSRV